MRRKLVRRKLEVARRTTRSSTGSRGQSTGRARQRSRRGPRGPFQPAGPRPVRVESPRGDPSGTVTAVFLRSVWVPKKTTDPGLFLLEVDYLTARGPRRPGTGRLSAPSRRLLPSPPPAFSFRGRFALVSVLLFCLVPRSAGSSFPLLTGRTCLGRDLGSARADRNSARRPSDCPRRRRGVEATTSLPLSSEGLGLSFAWTLDLGSNSQKGNRICLESGKVVFYPQTTSQDASRLARAAGTWMFVPPTRRPPTGTRRHGRNHVFVQGLRSRAYGRLSRVARAAWKRNPGRKQLAAGCGPNADGLATRPSGRRGRARGRRLPRRAERRAPRARRRAGAAPTGSPGSHGRSARAKICERRRQRAAGTLGHPNDCPARLRGLCGRFTAAQAQET